MKVIKVIPFDEKNSTTHDMDVVAADSHHAVGYMHVDGKKIPAIAARTYDNYGEVVDPGENYWKLSIHIDPQTRRVVVVDHEHKIYELNDSGNWEIVEDVPSNPIITLKNFFRD